MKAYTDLEQSKMLAEILFIESADMWYPGEDEDDIECGFDGVRQDLYIDYREGHPCWSLAALFDVLPEGVIENYYAPNFQKENGKYSIAYGDEELLCVADNPVDACYEMILKLYEQKLL